MRLAIMFCVIVLTSIVVYCDDCKSEKCPPVPKHYEEFGCTPVTEAGQCCPSQFDCSPFHNRDAIKCHYNNGTVEIGEELDTTDAEAPCLFGCYCTGGKEGISTGFMCGHVDCPEFFGGRLTVPGKKCIHQYNTNSCCINKTVCGEDLNKLAKCEFAGKSYYEGEKIYPGRSCYSCLCGKGFEDKPVEENKHCHKINCNMEVHYSDRMRRNCIPVFFKTDNCCPIGWRCPDNKTTVVPDPSRKTGEKSALKCTFGDLQMSLGDSLSPGRETLAERYKDQCTICTCKVPPYPYCITTC